jgi:hypothetical protein
MHKLDLFGYFFASNFVKWELFHFICYKLLAILFNLSSIRQLLLLLKYSLDHEWVFYCYNAETIYQSRWESRLMKHDETLCRWESQARDTHTWNTTRYPQHSFQIWNPILKLTQFKILLNLSKMNFQRSSFLAV